MLWPKLNIICAKYILGIKYKIIGIENLNNSISENRIICSNHQSTWETFFFASCLPKPICFIFKKELLYIPFFGWGIFLLDMIHINRKSGKNALQNIIESIPHQQKLNRWIAFFPEGTRISPGEEKPFKIGAAIISKKFNIPIIPITHNAGNFWGKNSFLKKPGTISIIIGKSILPNKKTPEEIIKEVKNSIEKQKL